MNANNFTLPTAVCFFIFLFCGMNLLATSPGSAPAPWAVLEADAAEFYGLKLEIRQVNWAGEKGLDAVFRAELKTKGVDLLPGVSPWKVEKGVASMAFGAARDSSFEHFVQFAISTGERGGILVTVSSENPFHVAMMEQRIRAFAVNFL